MIYMLRLQRSSQLVLLTLALANRWGIWALGIGIAFLHASLPKHPRILVWPPDDQEHFHGHLWQLEKAMYGLRVAPTSWQKLCLRLVTRTKMLLLSSSERRRLTD